MTFSVTSVVAPAAEPVALDEAKRHLRVDVTSRDLDIAAFITAAVAHVETLTRRALITRTSALRLDAFPATAIAMPHPPLRAVDSITYTDTNGDSQTWTPSDYSVDVLTEPGRIQPAFGEVYPATRGVFNAVTSPCNFNRAGRRRLPPPTAPT